MWRISFVGAGTPDGYVRNHRALLWRCLLFFFAATVGACFINAETLARVPEGASSQVKPHVPSPHPHRLRAYQLPDDVAGTGPYLGGQTMPAGQQVPQTSSPTATPT